MADHIVTRESLEALVTRGDNTAMHAIGRALVHLLNRQTREEQACNTTNVSNNMGFTGADAHSGCISAKYYLKHGKLLDWQIERWLKPGSRGFARITKYWKQLDEEAKAKRDEKEAA
jgi:hypothetical protein